MEEHPSLGPLLRQGMGVIHNSDWIADIFWCDFTTAEIYEMDQHGTICEQYLLPTGFGGILMIQTAASGTGKDGPRVSSVRWGSSTDSGPGKKAAARRAAEGFDMQIPIF